MTCDIGKATSYSPRTNIWNWNEHNRPTFGIIHHTKQFVDTFLLTQWK